MGISMCTFPGPTSLIPISYHSDTKVKVQIPKNKTVVSGVAHTTLCVPEVPNHQVVPPGSIFVDMKKS